MSPLLTPERVVVYRLSDLPPQLRRELPKGGEIERCLFFVARQQSAAIRGLFATLPEPHVENTAEGMGVSARVGRVLARGSMLASVLRPVELPPLDAADSSTFRFGFHAGTFEDAERSLLAGGAQLVNVRELLVTLAIIELLCQDGTPSRTATLVTGEGPTGEVQDLTPVEPGLFALDLKTERSLANAFIYDHSGGAAEATQCALAGVHRLTSERAGPEVSSLASGPGFFELVPGPRDPEQFVERLNEALLLLTDLEFFADEGLDDRDELSLRIEVWRSNRLFGLEVGLIHDWKTSRAIVWTYSMALPEPSLLHATLTSVSAEFGTEMKLLDAATDTEWVGLFNRGMNALNEFAARFEQAMNAILPPASADQTN